MLNFSNKDNNSNIKEFESLIIFIKDKENHYKSVTTTQSYFTFVSITDITNTSKILVFLVNQAFEYTFINNHNEFTEPTDHKDNNPFIYKSTPASATKYISQMFYRIIIDTGTSTISTANYN